MTWNHISLDCKTLVNAYSEHTDWLNMKMPFTLWEKFDWTLETVMNTHKKTIENCVDFIEGVQD